MNDLLLSQLAALAQVLVIDLMLAGDNAVVIGMAVTGLSAGQRRWAVLFGVGFAVVIRVAMAFVALRLLAIIGLRWRAGCCCCGFAGGCSGTAAPAGSWGGWRGEEQDRVAGDDPDHHRRYIDEPGQCAGGCRGARMTIPGSWPSACCFRWC